MSRRKTILILWILLLGCVDLPAQTSLELASKTDFYIASGGRALITRAEYLNRYRGDNSFQASNAVEVTMRHLNDTAIVDDQRNKAAASDKPKTMGPVTSISLVFSRPIFDLSFGTFSAADSAQIRDAIAKFRQWNTESASSVVGTELRRPFPMTLSWPVAMEVNGKVTLTEQPLLFLRDRKGESFMLMDKDKAFPAGMEKRLASTGAAAGEAAIGATNAKVTYIDHWMSTEDLSLFEAALDKVDALLKQNRVAIQKLQ
jgi:hypothetical protein